MYIHMIINLVRSRTLERKTQNLTKPFSLFIPAPLTLAFAHSSSEKSSYLPLV